MSLKPVCFLLSLCCAGSASALGLGELNVRSSLGQPLHATVTLVDATAEMTAACFSLDAVKGGVAPPPRAQLSLQRSGDQMLLHIRTLESVNDPVAQFVLTSDCEARLQREYTVLLDPPAMLAPSLGTAEPATEAPSARDAAAPAPRPRRPLRPAIRPSAAATVPAARPTEPASSNARTSPTDTAPRLVLSGKRGSANTPFALRLDTNLPDLARSPSEGLTATELSDENTALARKLAHLERQLVELQKRNEALEARRAPAPARITPPPERPAQWPLYLLIAALIGTGVALVTWLLRRSPSPKPILMDETPWTQQPDVPTMPLPVASPTVEREPERMLDLSEPPRDEGTELKEDILDQAEVFMAHGHGDLAVHLLQEHLREAPTESPVPWLLLLDLLHREGNTDGYAAASAECRRHFNINLASHPVSQDGEPGPGLEAYPHLLEQLATVWNTPGIDAFFQDLIYDNRGGTRMGFEPGAYREILLLRAISRDVLPLSA